MPETDCIAANEIRLPRGGRSLVMSGAFGRLELSAQRLREACRCSACESARRAGHPEAAQPDIAVSRIDPMGPRAFNLVFSDGHARGVFPWDYLQQLGAGAAPHTITEPA